jgi:hypothetical protein
MFSRDRCSRLLLVIAFGSTPLLAVGCGDDGLGTRYAVSGKVTYKGANVEKGKISFVPENSNDRGALGEIKDGYYSLTTQSKDDGAFPGKYKVVVDTRDIDENAAKAATEKFAKDKKIEGLKQIPQEVQAKILSKAKSSTPTKYMAAQSTPLTVEVKAQSNTIDITLED